MLANVAQSPNANPRWHAVVRCTGCGAPLPITEPFEAVSCGSCGHRQSLRPDTIARLRHHFAALEGYRRVATEARWQHEDIVGPVHSEERRRFSRVFFAVMTLLGAAATIAIHLRPNGASVFVGVAVFLAIGPARYVVSRIDLWNLARRRDAAGLDAVPISNLGWASCGNCGGRIQIGEATPACPFCSAELVPSPNAKAATRSAAVDHATDRVEQALDSRRELLAGQHAASKSGVEAQYGLHALWGTGVGGLAGSGSLHEFAGFPAWLAVPVAFAIAIAIAVVYYRHAVASHYRKLDAWHDEQLQSGRPIELQQELDRLRKRDGPTALRNDQTHL